MAINKECPYTFPRFPAHVLKIPLAPRYAGSVWPFRTSFNRITTCFLGGGAPMCK